MSLCSIRIHEFELIRHRWIDTVFGPNMFVRLCLIFVGFILFGVFLNIMLMPLAFLLGGILPSQLLTVISGIGSAVATFWIMSAAFRSVAETERKNEERRQRKLAEKQAASVSENQSSKE